MRHAKYSVIVLIFIQFISTQSFAAFELSPVVAHISSTGDGKTTTFKVTNTGETKIPIQISMVPREPDINGKEKYDDTGKIDQLFRVFPDQVILNPKETRNIRVTWTGAPRISSEQAFRVIAEELPVDVEDPNKVYKVPVAKLLIATKYIGSLYVVPNGAKPVLAVEAKPHEKSPILMNLDIMNTGTAHIIVKLPKIKLRSNVNGKEVVLSNEQVKKVAGENILAGRSRRFVLDWPKGLPAGPLKASLEVAQE